MEVRLDAVEGDPDPPADTFVSIRIGDVQKQSRFAATRTYRFPANSEQQANFGRVEVFKRVGSLTVPLDDGSDVHDLAIPCNDSECPRVSMRLSLKGCKIETNEKRVSAKSRIDAAKKYLASFQLEELLADATREVLHKKPSNPHAFLSQFILQHAADNNFTPPPLDASSKPPVSPSQSAPELQKSTPPPKPGMREGKKAQVTEPLPKSSPPLEAPTSPPLQQLVPTKEPAQATAPAPLSAPGDSMPYMHKPSVGTWIINVSKNNTTQMKDAKDAPVKDAPAPAPDTGPFQLRPSVGTWLARPSLAANLKPWYYTLDDKSNPYVKDLQDVIADKDKELEELKATLRALSSQP